MQNVITLITSQGEREVLSLQDFKERYMSQTEIEGEGGVKDFFLCDPGCLNENEYPDEIICQDNAYVTRL